MKQYTLQSIFLAFCALLALPGMATAATVFTDTFDSGAGTWAESGSYNSISVVDDSSGIGSGNALTGDVSGSVNALTNGFSSTTLSSIGDSITLSFDYRWTATGSATSRAPAFGLYNTNATGSLDDDFGYQLETNPADVRLSYEFGTQNTILAGSDTDLLETTLWNDYLGVNGNFSMTLTRIADSNADSFDDVNLSFSFIDYATPANNLITSTIDTENQTFTFNEVAVRSGNRDFYIDNVAVTTIPEPASVLLLLGAFGLLAVSGRFGRKR